jgi:lantibiotic modifying enzyme
MSLTAAEIEGIVRAVEPNPSTRSRRTRELRELLAMLGDYRFRPRQARALTMLCRAGVDHGWKGFEKQDNTGLLTLLSSKAKANLKRNLQSTLERITRPSFELEWMSFTLAVRSLGFPNRENPALTARMFLRENPDDRLGLLFKKFPALAYLWTLATVQWRDHVLELLGRIRKDRAALSKAFFKQGVPNQIMDLRLGLSDPHHGGRSVSLIVFNRDNRVIYKPRSGQNELAWFSFLGWMNQNGFQPKLRLLRVLVRKDYCWMEFAGACPCSNGAAVRRFYERLGGLIAAAYLLKAVDCHRENLIAAGEDPLLVDTDALWHVSPVTKAQSVGDVLYGTGFFPNAKRRSLRSRSSVLGPASRGDHLPHLGCRSIPPGRYGDAIMSGFHRAWRCVLGNPARRTAFRCRVESIRARKRRWIYRATTEYGAILRASVRPAVLHSAAERGALVSELSRRSAVSKSVVQAEINALCDLDIPYFTRRTRGPMPPEPTHLPSALLRAIRTALEWTEQWNQADS